MANKTLIICICAMLASFAIFAEAGKGDHGGGDLGTMLAAGLITLLLGGGSGSAQSAGGQGRVSGGHGQGMAGYGQGMAGYGQGMVVYGQDMARYGQGMAEYGLLQDLAAYVVEHPMAGYGGARMPLDDGLQALLLGLNSPLYHGLV